TPPFPRARAEPSEQSQRDQRSAYLLDFSRGKAGIKKLDGPSGSRLNVTTFATTLATRDSEAGIGLPRVDAEGPLRPDVRTRLGMPAPEDDPCSSFLTAGPEQFGVCRPELMRVPHPSPPSQAPPPEAQRPFEARQPQLGATLIRARAEHGSDNAVRDRKSTRLNSSHVKISYAVFCLKKKKRNKPTHAQHTPKSRH